MGGLLNLILQLCHLQARHIHTIHLGRGEGERGGDRGEGRGRRGEGEARERGEKGNEGGRDGKGRKEKGRTREQVVKIKNPLFILHIIMCHLHYSVSRNNPCPVCRAARVHMHHKHRHILGEVEAITITILLNYHCSFKPCLSCGEKGEGKEGKREGGREGGISTVNLP